MSEFQQARITVKKVAAYGFLANDTWFKVDIKERPDITHKSFVEGQTYDIAYTASSKGKLYVKQVLAGNLVAAPAAVPAAAPGLPSVPGLPPIPGAAPALPPLAASPSPLPSIPAASPAPAASAPAPFVPPAPTLPPPAAAPKSGDTDKMTKGEWARKDVVVARQAVIKSTLESPAVANLTMGLDQASYLNYVKAVASDLEAWVNRP